jgi:hypothetical protein
VESVVIAILALAFLRPWWCAMLPAEGFGPQLKTICPFERAVHDSTLCNSVAAILPTERHVQHEVKGEEALPTFRRTPDKREADARNEALDEIELLLAGLEFVEGIKRKREG